MSVAKVLELAAESTSSFDDALHQGISKASETISGIRSVWIENQQVTVENGQITKYRVHMKVTFVLND